MEWRTLGGSGLKVPVLALGTGTFGGGGEFFKGFGSSDVAEASPCPKPAGSGRR